MSNDLLKQLEEKINAAIETIELSRMEITELKEQNDELENRYVDWEDRLSALIDKFEQLEDGEKENSEEVVEEELDTASQSEEDSETSSQSEEELEASSQIEEELESSGKYEEEFETSNNKANGEEEEARRQELSPEYPASENGREVAGEAPCPGKLRRREKDYHVHPVKPKRGVVVDDDRHG